MKKSGMLNSEISRVLSYMGHTDCICIGDAGLPIPEGVERIDIALTLGTPSFMDTLRAVASDMCIEKIILAEEIKTKNPSVLEEICALFVGVETAFITHEQLKLETKKVKAVIRTGEATPYANIILQSGVVF